VQLGELSRLSSLRQLDASGNRISSLLQLTLLTGLSQLSAEGNHLTSLAGVTSMTGLLELYAAHNAVTDIKVGWRHTCASGACISSFSATCNAASRISSTGGTCSHNAGMRQVSSRRCVHGVWAFRLWAAAVH
jgi:Leucine-rich repeat (LRR) protein